MIGSMSGCEQFAISVKQYFEVYDCEIPDKLWTEYLNIYNLAKTEKKENVEKSERSIEKIEDLVSS